MSHPHSRPYSSHNIRLNVKNLIGIDRLKRVANSINVLVIKAPNLEAAREMKAL
jgi:hypothetical protein